MYFKNFIYLFLIIFIFNISFVFSNNFYFYSLSNTDNISIDLEKTNFIYIDDYKIEILEKGDLFFININGDYFSSNYKFLKKSYENKTNFNFKIKINYEDLNLKVLNLDKLNANKSKSLNEIILTNDFSSFSFSSIASYDRLKVFIKFNESEINNSFILEKKSDLNLSIKEKLSDRKKIHKKNRDLLVKDMKKYYMSKSKKYSSSNLNLILKEYEILNGVYSYLSLDEIKYIYSLKYVENIELEQKYNLLLIDTPQIIKSNEIMSYLDINGTNISGKGIVVAVLDTGIDYTHKDFASCSYEDYMNETCVKFVKGFNFVENNFDPMDLNGHGTHVAGIIGANGDLKGIAPDVKLMPIKVLDKYGAGSLSDIISGIEYAINKSVDILSISLGGLGNSNDAISTAVNLAVDYGISVVVAGGNSGPSSNTIMSPGLAEKVITVAASCKDGEIGINPYCLNSKIASFSSRGPVLNENYVKPEISAPGVNICSSKIGDFVMGENCFDNEHVFLSGTSMATPVVSGIIALIKQYKPDLSPNEIKNLIINSAKDLDENIFVQGYGEIDAKEIFNQIDFFSSDLEVNITNIYFNDLNNLGFFNETFTIKNIANHSLEVNLSLNDFFKDNLNYSIGNISVNQINLSPNEEINISFYINTSDLIGNYKSKIEISFEEKLIFIPIIISNYIKFNLKITNDLSYDDFSLNSIFLFDGIKSYSLNNISNLSLEIYEKNYFSEIDYANYTILILGATDDYDGLKFLLIKDVFLNQSSYNYYYYINLSESREYTIDGEAFDGDELRFYEYNFGYFAYNNESNISLHSILNDYLYTFGNKRIRVSNKSNIIDNIDVIIKFEGVK